VDSGGTGGAARSGGSGGRAAGGAGGGNDGSGGMVGSAPTGRSGGGCVVMRHPPADDQGLFAALASVLLAASILVRSTRGRTPAGRRGARPSGRVEQGPDEAPARGGGARIAPIGSCC
jgi:hypothetical protein